MGAARLILSVAVGLAALTACGPTARHVTISVDRPAAMVDIPVDVRIGGLSGDGQVTLRAESRDYGGVLWRSESRYRVRSGTVDVAREAPDSGSYQGVDGMGPFWSMTPTDGDPDRSLFFAPKSDGYEVTVSAIVDGRTAASTVVTRRTEAPGVRRTELRPEPTGLFGTYVAPPVGARRVPAVLAFGGSEGGAGTGTSEAEVLAAHGYPALGLAYFGVAGRPDSLERIPLEYFATALRWLRAQPGVDPGRILVWGVSRGAEAALLVAATFPDLVDGVIAAAPSSVANPAAPDRAGTVDPTAPAWTLGGQPVPPGTVIPVERIRGPVLTVAGGDDRLWPSAPYAQAVMARLDAKGFPYPHRNLTYPGAGHTVGVLIPYSPVGGTVEASRYGLLHLGGTPTANAQALEDVWPKVLDFLAAQR